jgi:HEAT repeat protein
MDGTEVEPLSTSDDPRSTDELVSVALSETGEHAAWKPVSLLQRRGTREVFATAARLCVSACPRERELGANILGQLGPPERPFREESLPVLLQMLSDEIDEGVLQAVAVALGHLADARAVEPLARLRHHPSAEVRYAVVHGLLGHRAQLAVSSLIELSTDDHAHVRDWATFGLGSQIETDTPEIRDTLARRLADPHDETRAEALVGLALRHDERVVNPLIRELSSEWVGTMALEAALELGDARLLPALLDLTDWWDLDPPLLEEAIKSCRQGPHERLSGR